MKANHGSLCMMVLLLLGFLAVPPMAGAQDPVIQFVSPAGSPRITAASDPSGAPIPVDVEVAFPLIGGTCAPPPPPVVPGTLEVKVQQLLDASVQGEETIDTSGWTWTGTDSVAGQVSVGGSGWSLYGIKVCIGNGAGSACATKLVRVEHPVSEFVGRPVYFGSARLSQSPPGCLLATFLETQINNMISAAPFSIDAPAAPEYPAEPCVFDLPLPLGTVSFPANLDIPGNNVALGVDDLGAPAPVSMSIDLGPYGLPGSYNCLIGGSADGDVYGEVSPNFDLDGRLRVFDISVGLGSGSGGCSISTPAPACNMYITVDGNPTL